MTQEIDTLYSALGEAERYAKELEQKLAEAKEALEFYADPESYHAIAFAFDPPCGQFADDFSEDHGDDFYQRPMPGKRAREFLNSQPESAAT